MDLNETQQRIEAAIRSLCVPDEPYTTAADIAEWTSLAKRTVLNHIEGVVRENDDIKMDSIGQANLYYVIEHTLDDVWTDDTESALRIEGNTEAAFAEIRNASGDSPFDYTVHWYDHAANELDDYVPTAREMGQVIEGWGSEPVSFKFYEQEHLDAEFEKVEP